MSLDAGAIWQPVLAAGAFWTLVAVLGGLATEIGPWYRTLRKPRFQPPDWLFGPAWTLIFVLLTWAVVEAWITAPNEASRHRLLWAVVANGALNVAWSVLFFKLRRPDWALIEVVMLWLSIAALIVVVAPWSMRAAWLFAPYLAWVTFASVLNLAIVRRNAPF